ncbi:MAG: hypothetical protein Q8P90_01130 [bacterium]|nr:hypothetical protein [bacterium]
MPRKNDECVDLETDEIDDVTTDSSGCGAGDGLWERPSVNGFSE